MTEPDGKSDWRTRIIRDLNRFAWDNPEVDALPDDAQEAILEVVEKACEALCGIAGHVPVADQCGNPAHDMCMWCAVAMPNAAPRPTPGGSND